MAEAIRRQEYGPAKGLIPLMAIVQVNKDKVRPVMDFCELNSHVDAFTAGADVCADKLREWRRLGTNMSIVDLRRAYLQLHVHESLWPFQTVVYHSQRHCLTRLGFGLNVAPSVMKAVLTTVLKQDETVDRATSAYLDDIMVNEDIASVASVESHLLQFGLECNPAERVADGARVLGLYVWGERGELHWKRNNAFGEIADVLTRRSVFSFCGKLIGHLPVCGWLRVATVFIKRRANSLTKYQLGTVTKLISSHTVEVGGMPRHVRDLRSAVLLEANPERAPRHELLGDDDEAPGVAPVRVRPGSVVGNDDGVDIGRGEDAAVDANDDAAVDADDDAAVDADDDAAVDADDDAASLPAARHAAESSNSEDEAPPERPGLRRSTRERRAPNWFMAGQ